MGLPVFGCALRLKLAEFLVKCRTNRSYSLRLLITLIDQSPEIVANAKRTWAQSCPSLPTAKRRFTVLVSHVNKMPVISTSPHP